MSGTVIYISTCRQIATEQNTSGKAMFMLPTAAVEEVVLAPYRQECQALF